MGFCSASDNRVLVVKLMNLSRIICESLNQKTWVLKSFSDKLQWQ